MSFEQTGDLLPRAESRPRSRRSALKAVVYLASLAAVAFAFVQGVDFYRTPLAERAHQEGYWQWKAGGTIGHTLGVAGSAMMVLMLGYSLRKRVDLLRRAGPLGRSLDVHIYLGVFGPLLVALSGVLGRYRYLQIPRTRAGEEIALAALEGMDHRLSERLSVRFGLDPSELARLDAVVPAPSKTGGARPCSTCSCPEGSGRP